MSHSRASTVTLVAGMLALTAAGLALAACGSKSGSGTTPALTATAWNLVTYSVGGQVRTPPPNVLVDARFSADTISGSSGVNSYSGPYTLGTDGALKIGPLASTQMAGPPAAMAVESAYLNDLQAAARATVSGSTLTLLDAKGTTLLTFAAQTEAAITGHEWLVTGYNNGKQAVVSPLLDTTLTATFADGGALSGSGGVNDYHGTYTLDGSAITIGPLTSTRKAGPAKQMEQEQLYLAALQSATSWELIGSRLELRSSDGALAVTFTGATQ